MNRTDRQLLCAGLLLGVGLGAFVDGIVFHQLLQAHNMLSSKYPTQGPDVATRLVNLEINMFWDGAFHACAWLVTALGVVFLWEAGRSRETWSAPIFYGSLPLGWGLFNVVEGVVDHHLLHLHHVTETPNHLLFDLLFLGASGVLIAIGAIVIQRGRGAVPAGRTKPRGHAFSSP